MYRKRYITREAHRKRREMYRKKDSSHDMYRKEMYCTRCIAREMYRKKDSSHDMYRKEMYPTTCIAREMYRKEIFRKRDASQEKCIVRDVSHEINRKTDVSQETCIARDMYRKRHVSQKRHV